MIWHSNHLLYSFMKTTQSPLRISWIHNPLRFSTYQSCTEKHITTVTPRDWNVLCRQDVLCDRKRKPIKQSHNSGSKDVIFLFRCHCFGVPVHYETVMNRKLDWKDFPLAKWVELSTNDFVHKPLPLQIKCPLGITENAEQYLSSSSNTDKV